MSSTAANTAGGAGQGALLPREFRYKQHMAEVLLADHKCRDDQSRAKLAVEQRIAYEDFIGIPRAARLNQMVAISMAPDHPQRPRGYVAARMMADKRLSLEEALYDMDRLSKNKVDQSRWTSAKAYLETHNAELRQGHGPF
ncbi:hypothetical protein LTR70_009850 [Exophiala xenobiotica]|uniref:Uncharacterized protein n=1 Tax=Lithohypha guttulata TaxID=1690604 RepID=A0ABR0KDD1_9EURO|nr:hypothetical protein LTR24_004042 [Lithohypha guttulata]KAK5309947.1 hypothetical protein LTR70_009850 [Exophiala xenobiotica]